MNSTDLATTEPKPVVAKKKISEESKVAQAIVGFTKKRAEQLKNDLTNQKSSLKSTKEDLQKKRRTLLTLKRTTVDLESRYKEFAMSKRSELVDKYRKAVTLLKTHPLVENFDVDIQKRVIVTTKPIKIKRKEWKTGKIAGVYQIRIDFSKSEYSNDNAIQILNITQRCDEYDHPTVLDTHACWGNVGGDIAKDFKNQDLYELVIDLVDYISTPFDGHGMLQWKGAKPGETRGWQQFFSHAKPQLPGFSFDQYDQDKLSKKVKDTTVSENGAIRWTNEYLQYAGSVLELNVAATTTTYITTGVGVYATTNATDEMAIRMREYQLGKETNRDKNLMSVYEREVAEQLEYMGFTRPAALHFTRLIMKVAKDPIDSVDLRDRHDFIEMFVTFTQNLPAKNFEGDYVAVTRGDTHRFFINYQDLNEEAQEHIRTKRTSQYRFRVNNYDRPQNYFTGTVGETSVKKQVIEEDLDKFVDGLEKKLVDNLTGENLDNNRQAALTNTKKWRI